MPTDPRDAAMARALEARQRLGLAIQRDTLNEITRILESARDRVVGQLAAAPSDYQRWSLTRLQAEIEAALREIETRGLDALKSGILKSQLAGAEGVDAALDAGLAADGLKLASLTGEIALPELAALDHTLVPLVKGITKEAGDKITNALGQTILGAKPVHQTITDVSKILTEGGRKRARTIVRTELGRAYADAAYRRLVESARVLPGLKKQWRRSGKIHSRIAHDAVDGQIRSVPDFFLVDGERLLFPRDPAASARNTVNCGCTMLPFMESWKVRQPGARRISDEELAKSSTKRSLADVLG